MISKSTDATSDFSSHHFPSSVFKTDDQSTKSADTFYVSNVHKNTDGSPSRLGSRLGNRDDQASENHWGPGWSDDPPEFFKPGNRGDRLDAFLFRLRKPSVSESFMIDISVMKSFLTLGKMLGFHGVYLL